MSKESKKRARGPEPERVKIAGSWENAIKKALKKQKHTLHPTKSMEKLPEK